MKIYMLGALGGLLGASRGRLGADLGASRNLQWRPERHGGFLGASWGCLGGLLGSPGKIFSEDLHGAGKMREYIDFDVS